MRHGEISLWAEDQHCFAMGIQFCRQKLDSKNWHIFSCSRFETNLGSAGAVFLATTSCRLDLMRVSRGLFVMESLSEV